MKFNRKNNFLSYFLFLFRKGIILFFLLGLIAASAQIHISEGTSFVVNKGTLISTSTKDSISKQKVKVYVKSEKTLKNISASEQFEIVLNQNQNPALQKSKLAQNKSSQSKKEAKKENAPKDIKDEKPDFPKIASFPVPKSCLSNADGSIDAIVPVQHQSKKTSIKLVLVLEKVLIETDSKLQHNYFWIDKISNENSETHSIRPPPVFVIV